MPKKTHLSGSIGQFKLDLVEPKTTPRFLMMLNSVFSCILLNYRFRILYLFLKYSVSVGLALSPTIGFTRPIYSPKTDRVRITLPSMRL